MPNHKHTPSHVALAFLNTMPEQDMDSAARYLHDDVVFEGPLSRFDSAVPYLQALGEFSRAVQGIDILATVQEGDAVVVMYEMRTGPFGPVRPIDHFVVRDGRIAKDSLVFDTYRSGRGPPPEDEPVSAGPPTLAVTRWAFCDCDMSLTQRAHDIGGRRRGTGVPEHPSNFASR